MNGVVRSALGTRIWAFLFPVEISSNQTRRQYRGREILLWLVAGLLFSSLGWTAGGFLGSWAPRTACAVAATALVLGLLNKRPGVALVGAVIAAVASLAAVRIGETFFSPLLAWPVAGLVIGGMGAFAFRRRRARIAFIVCAPFLGAIGLLAGMIVTVLAAIGMDDSRVLAQFMLGGAGGFGFLLLAGAVIAGRWLDTARTAGGEL
jgi:FtsH-binding integral membrane protein